MELPDFLIRFARNKVDKRNLIKNIVVGAAKEDNPTLILEFITLIENELAEAKRDIKKWLETKDKI